MLTIKKLVESGYFDPVWYAQTYADVMLSGMSPSEHFVRVGLLLNRAPSRNFDPARYAAHNRDIAAAGLNPFLHFIEHGANEGRQALPVERAHPLNGRARSAPPRPGQLGETSPRLAYEVRAIGTIYGKPDLPPDLAARTKYQEITGEKDFLPHRPNVLLVAHSAAKEVFGSERSFMDVLEALALLPVNVVVALPRDIPQYTRAVLRHSAMAVVFNYGWWKSGHPLSADTISTFSRLIVKHGISLVHSNTIMLRECLLAARAQLVPTVVHVRELISGDPYLAAKIGLMPDDIVMNVVSDADWIIANSAATAKAFYKPGRTFTLPNTVNVEDFLIDNVVNGGVVRFGLISSNIEKKGLTDVLALASAAAREGLGAEFLLIGPTTPLLEAIKERQKQGDVPASVKFPGYAANPREAISQVNVVLSFSHFAESFGRTATEAMAGGRPVIAYNNGALPELIRHGVNGFLIPYRQPETALPYLRLLCGDHARLREMGERGRTIARELYSRPHFEAKVIGIYSEMLAELGPTPRRQVEGMAAERIVRPARRAGISTPRSSLKVAYFCWHFPVPSETFVLNELAELIHRGVDVIVFCRQIPHKDFKLPFAITFERVSSHEELAKRLEETGRTVVHAHFTYPTVTDMVWPACEKAKIPFTFIAHAQDIFVYGNDAKNRLAEIGQSELCIAMFTLSEYHLDYVTQRGFPRRKVIINPNAISTDNFERAGIENRAARSFRRIIAVHRFVPKKGLDLLIKAAEFLQDLDLSIDIYGYGDQEANYRQLIRELGLGNVTINGALSQEGVVDVMRRADLFACPSVRVVETGDMDGLPTSVVESMAARLPVLTTNIGALPELVVDGITGIVASADPKDIADAIRSFYSMPTAQVEAMIETAHARVVRHDVKKLASVLQKVWENRTVDIVVVSWNNLEELRAVVERILSNTSLPFHLIVCDNLSEREPVSQFLDALWARDDRVTIVHNDVNAFVGPGTNAALEQGTSEYAIYVCGREGISFTRGWELPFVHHFDANPDCGLNGTVGYSPTYLKGADYPKGVREFAKFRNQSFAHDNPERTFGHIQGGLFGLRRKMFDEIGGFSDAVPHDYTDVEYSFYAESHGWKLENVSGVLALFTKTRPTLSQRFDETIVAAHPVLPRDIANLERLRQGKVMHCNVCDWYGETFDDDSCPSCQNGRRGRTLYRWLSDSIHMFRRLPALAIGLDPSADAFWGTQFQGPRFDALDFAAALKRNGQLPNKSRGLKLGVWWLDQLPADDMDLIASELGRLIAADGPVLLQPSERAQEDGTADRACERIRSAGFELVKRHRYVSRAVQFSYIPMLEFARGAE